ncbi:MerR family transcriptional regulator [Kibdelosporangium aridum]|uniref:MerR family transcriptional regulator n=1 Tax=Kibdelosporangium aridum TaxID=2030 RepID=UPI0006905014
MLIGEFAKQVGVSTDTIRFYEKVGFFSRNRRENGYRVYTEKDLETAQLIASGKSMGFSLREILQLTNQLAADSWDHPRIQQNLQEKVELIDARIASLSKVRVLIQKQIAYCRDMERQEKRRA